MASVKVKIHRYSSSREKHNCMVSALPCIAFEEWARTWLQTYKKGKVSENIFLYTYENTVEKHL